MPAPWPSMLTQRGVSADGTGCRGADKICPLCSARIPSSKIPESAVWMYPRRGPGAALGAVSTGSQLPDLRSGGPLRLSTNSSNTRSAGMMTNIMKAPMPNRISRLLWQGCLLIQRVLIAEQRRRLSQAPTRSLPNTPWPAHGPGEASGVHAHRCLLQPIPG